jgi:hypothetical protein
MICLPNSITNKNEITASSCGPRKRQNPYFDADSSIPRLYLTLKCYRGRGFRPLYFFFIRTSKYFGLGIDVQRVSFVASLSKAAVTECTAGSRLSMR